MSDVDALGGGSFNFNFNTDLTADTDLTFDTGLELGTDLDFGQVGTGLDGLGGSGFDTTSLFDLGGMAPVTGVSIDFAPNGSLLVNGEPGGKFEAMTGSYSLTLSGETMTGSVADIFNAAFDLPGFDDLGIGGDITRVVTDANANTWMFSEAGAVGVVNWRGDYSYRTDDGTSARGNIADLMDEVINGAIEVHSQIDSLTPSWGFEIGFQSPGGLEADVRGIDDLQEMVDLHLSARPDDLVVLEAPPKVTEADRNLLDLYVSQSPATKDYANDLIAKGGRVTVTGDEVVVSLRTTESNTELHVPRNTLNAGPTVVLQTQEGDKVNSYSYQVDGKTGAILSSMQTQFEGNRSRTVTSRGEVIESTTELIDDLVTGIRYESKYADSTGAQQKAVLTMVLLDGGGYLVSGRATGTTGEERLFNRTFKNADELNAFVNTFDINKVFPPKR